MTYSHKLTEGEIACGVTLDQVAELLPKGLFTHEGQKFILPKYTGPALALSTARCAFKGNASYLGLNSLGQPVYGADKETN